MSPRAAARLESIGFERVYDYAAGKADWLAAGLPGEGEKLNEPTLADVMLADVPTCRLDEVLGIVLQRLGEANHCAVVDNQRVVLGELTTKQLDSDPSARIGDVMQEGARTFRPNVTLAEMRDWFSTRQGIDSVLVTNPEGELLGIVAHDILHHA